MPRSYRTHVPALAGTLLAICVGALGCGALPCHDCCGPDVPHELKRVTPPAYVIEPPDILLIDAIRLVPRPPYRIEPLDILGIQVTQTLPNAPIMGLYSVEPSGTVNLGFTYGSIKVAGKTIEEAKIALEQSLKRSLKPPYEVTVVIAEFRAMQQVRGEHLVRPDGTVSLGTYGNVAVDGLTIPEAKAVIEMYLSNYLVDPQISLDVAGFNSRVYYVITDGGGSGEQVVRLPSTGKETVLDAISFIGGLSPVASKNRIWVARPTPSDLDKDQTLAVDWVGITQRGKTATNYQIMPGDRVYVMSAPLIRTDTFLARVISPVERVCGILLLVPATVNALQRGASGGVGTGTGG